ncbi:MAG: NAD(P)-binding domain-containing protein [candidate division KSB1 bacterium]|nr:NAD(P)-binding domain-containing protein [candidate division KSB1 bacterium]MDZ7364326.1 NAD(P)-binding domain-containing protein [candidate division KSB1 bacterium]MDZ7402698.1 NAD(P)-binding domain-containing protein [candidate division KSB1 bacterium]
MPELFIVLALALLLVGWQHRHRAKQDRLHQSKLQQNIRDGIAAPPSLHPFINPDLCIGCGSCITACPEQNVLGLVNMKSVLLQPDHCVGHGKCEVACPVGAITLVLGARENGVEVPVTDEFFQTRVPGVYVAGELGGIGLIRNSMRQGMQCIDAIAAKPQKNAARYDVIIVGAGPAGLGATLQAAAKKLRYLTLEQNDIGGTVLKYPRRKVVMTAPLHLPGYGKIHFRDVRKEDLLAEWQKIIQKTGINIQTKTRVEKIERKGNVLEVIAGNHRYTAANVVLALGRRGTPRQLGVPGEELPKVIYQLDDPQEFAGRHCLVVGGGDSALECALMLADAGARVALSYRQGTIARAKPRNRQLFEEAVRQRRIHALMPSVVKAIAPQSVRLEVNGEEKNIPNDDVIVMAGGVMPFEFLKEIGIEMRTLYGEPLPGRKSV